MFSQAGKVGPGYCTGVGKAIMAFLSDDARSEAMKYQSFYRHTQNTLTSHEVLSEELETIKSAGIAFDKEEHETGIICIAAPILTTSRRVIGAISITTSTSQHTLESLSDFRPSLEKTASNIATAAEDWQFPS